MKKYTHGYIRVHDVVQSSLLMLLWICVAVKVNHAVITIQDSLLWCLHVLASYYSFEKPRIFLWLEFCEHSVCDNIWPEPFEVEFDVVRVSVWVFSGYSRLPPTVQRHVLTWLKCNSKLPIDMSSSCTSAETDTTCPSNSCPTAARTGSRPQDVFIYLFLPGIK